MIRADKLFVIFRFPIMVEETSKIKPGFQKVKIGAINFRKLKSDQKDVDVALNE